MGHDPFGLIGLDVEGKYRVDEVVAEGGFAVLYRAVNLRLRVPVALKCLKVRANTAGAERDRFLERFLAEGQVLHRLSRGTLGIVQALDAGALVTASGEWVPYLVLEWLEGQTLTEELEERTRSGAGERPLEAAMSCLEPAVLALDYAHHQGITHRDIKPDNLFFALIGGVRTLKIVDFGIAKVVDEVALLTPTSETMSMQSRAYSPPYAAPEQFDPKLGATGPWTDVYALALVLVETVTGRRGTVGSTALELRDRAMDQERRPTFSSQGVKVSEAVERVMARALAVDPRNRQRTAGEFWKALRAAMSQSAAKPAPPAEGSRSVATETADVIDRNSPASAKAAPGALEASAPVAKTRKKSANVGVVALMLLGVGAAVIVALLAWIPDTSEHRPPVTPTDPPPGLDVSPARPVGAATSDSDMVPVREGQYDLGSLRGVSSRCERPHRTLVNRFLIDRTEVTAGAYRRCVTAGACTSTRDHAQESARSKGLRGPELCNELRLDRGEITADHPINCVDLFQAQQYCAFVHKRLPTSAEWEAAARGEAANEYPWGDRPPTCEDAVYATLNRHGRNRCQPTQGTLPVGRLGSPSPFGALDMAGNVWEFASGTCSQSGRDSLLHGGGYDGDPDKPDTLATWRRFPWPSGQGGISAGFRCARSLGN